MVKEKRFCPNHFNQKQEYVVIRQHGCVLVSGKTQLVKLFICLLLKKQWTEGVALFLSPLISFLQPLHHTNPVNENSDHFIIPQRRFKSSES